MPTSASDIAHLLRRSGYGTTRSEVTNLARLTLTEAVDTVLNTSAAPADARADAASTGNTNATREEAIAAINASSKEIHAALDSIYDGNVNAEIAMPFMSAPMTFWMNLPAMHFSNHAAQIDYLQTIWGDMDWHFM